MTLDQHLAVVECSSEGRETILKQMDLIDRRHAYPSELSQGERSRAAVARALSTNAALLVMDEPLCHVDPVRKSSYWNVITKRLEEQGTALIFSSHEPETVLGWSSDVVCLHEGKVLHHGKTRALYDGPPSEQTGRLLGPLNWFSQEECLIFLDLPIATRHGLPVRPENITVEATGLNDSSLEIVATHFSGGYSQSIIRHRETGKLCSVTHRSGTAIRAGSLVKLNLIRHDSLSCSEFA
jgi:ABC-type Fe3+/spermidine/putrescine transport system ATPase subunit